VSRRREDNLAETSRGRAELQSIRTASSPIAILISMFQGGSLNLQEGRPHGNLRAPSSERRSFWDRNLLGGKGNIDSVKRVKGEFFGKKNGKQSQLSTLVSWYEEIREGKGEGRACARKT